MRPLPSKKLMAVMLVLAILGFADAAYLAFESLRGVIPPCTTGGCEAVLTSAYSHIGPVPISVPGALFYLFIIVLVILSLDTKNGRYVRWASWLMMPAFALSVVLVVLQAFVIHSYCFYCLIFESITTLLMICGIGVLKQTKVVEQIGQS